MLRNHTSKTTRGSSAAISALALAMGICAHAATVHRLSVCANGAGDPTKSLSCPPNNPDTQQSVAGQGGIATINQSGFSGVSDEHQTIFPPNALNDNSGYMFFLATRSQNAPGTGLVVLQSPPAGPDSSGKWTLGPVKGYGFYPALNSYGQVFLAPVPHDACPKVSSASKQDPTFDLNYAAPGSVVSDPTNPGSLVMIYEGSNTCVGFDQGPGTTPQQGGVYVTTGVATSVDYGKSWPVYRSDFLTPPGLPEQNSAAGPEAPLGAFGYGVCMGDFCPYLSIPPANYGRYPVLSPPGALSDIMKWGRKLPLSMADSEPSAFVDDAVQPQYIYVVHDDGPGDPSLAYLGLALKPPFPDGRVSDLAIARAQLNGGTAPLSFKKWNGKEYAAPGMDGTEQQLLPDGDFGNCADVSQLRHAGSISYVEETHQYLLLFVCDSQGEPLPGHSPGGPKGAAWFWSTSTDLSNPALWTAPQPVAGTWSVLGANGAFNGWYPSLMSLNKSNGHLSTSPLNAAYGFSMSGSQGPAPPPLDSVTGARTYMSRSLTISAK
jgi:hypothetical protein